MADKYIFLNEYDGKQISITSIYKINIDLLPSSEKIVMTVFVDIFLLFFI